MTDLIDFVRLLTALISFFTALVGLSEALKQRSKHNTHCHKGIDPLTKQRRCPALQNLGYRRHYSTHGRWV